MPNDRNQERQEKDSCRDTAWVCTRCECLLGYVDMPRRDAVRLKYKDSYTYIGEPAWVRVICRQCAAINDLCDNEKLKEKTSSSANEESAPCA